MKIQKALEFIQHRDGKIFTIRFTKRTTGELREMVCRQGVKKYLAGGKSIDFASHKLIPVYDMQKQAYRSISIEGITEIKVDGTWRKVTFK